VGTLFIRRPDLKSMGFWLYQITGWTGFIAVITFRDTLQALNNHVGRGDLSEQFLSMIFYVVLGIALTSLLRYFYRFVYQKQCHILTTLVIIIVTSVVITILHEIFLELYQLILPPHEFSNLLVRTIRLIWNYPIFFGWSILYFGIKFRNQSVLERDRAEKANLLAQTAQLQMLRYQLNPHFLFNSLNSIWALIDEDKKASKEMVSELAEFLRYSLMSKNYSDVPLRQEIEAIRHYLSIEKKRFEEKLEVEFDIDPEAEEFPVLSFILNPLVENAIKYGMRTSILPLKIIITAKVRNHSLMLQVSNTGKWVTAVEKENGSGTGTGLQNIRLRLENAFPGKSGFEIGQLEDMITATIVIHGKS
jgi:two-component system LytT family sensor kinase